MNFKLHGTGNIEEMERPVGYNAYGCKLVIMIEEGTTLDEVIHSVREALLRIENNREYHGHAKFGGKSVGIFDCQLGD